VIVCIPAPCQADDWPILAARASVNVTNYAVTVGLVESVNLHLSPLTVNVVGDGLGEAVGKKKQKQQ
jgi:hypothetical protein